LGEKKKKGRGKKARIAESDALPPLTTGKKRKGGKRPSSRLIVSFFPDFTQNQVQRERKKGRKKRKRGGEKESQKAA